MRRSERFWPSSSTLATDAKYKVTVPGSITTVTANQRQGGSAWHLLKSVTLAANDNWQVDLSDQTSAAVAADAVAVVPTGTADSFTWTLPVPSRGSYQLYVTWSSASDRATDATYQINAASPGTVNIVVDQSRPNNGWRFMGNYTFDNTSTIVLSSSLTGSVSADAIRVVGTGANAGISFILSDHLGQPQKLTDSSGALTWDRTSTPFGETVSLTNPGNLVQPLRFPGQQLDATTSLSYNYFRDSDASLGRYIQSNPIGLGGGLNAYAYVEGNPVSSALRLNFGPRGGPLSKQQLGSGGFRSRSRLSVVRHQPG
jgi:RHS repeat-associated protein